MKKIKRGYKLPRTRNPLVLEKGKFRATFSYRKEETGLERDISFPIIVTGEPTKENLALARQSTLEQLLQLKQEVDNSNFSTTAEAPEEVKTNEPDQVLQG